MKKTKKKFVYVLVYWPADVERDGLQIGAYAGRVWLHQGDFH